MFPRMIVFDKDGTLIDNAAWDRVFGDVLDCYVRDDDRDAAASAFGYDLAAGVVQADSPILWESNAWFLDRLVPFAQRPLDRPAFDTEVEAFVAQRVTAYATEIDGASELIEELSLRGVLLAVCTNDSETSSRAQIAQLGWADRFPIIFGYDSGHGSKPEPGMLRQATRTAGIEPVDAVMIGDSSTDVGAAAAAGMRSVYIGADPVLSSRATHTIDDLRQVLDLFA